MGRQSPVIRIGCHGLIGARSTRPEKTNQRLPIEYEYRDAEYEYEYELRQTDAGDPAADLSARYPSAIRIEYIGRRRRGYKRSSQSEGANQAIHDERRSQVV